MTPEQRKSYAQALGGQKPGATWTNIPPARTGRQVEGASILPLGRYEMPDGSSQVSFGLPQGALDAYRSMRYGLGFEQDPDAPDGYVSEGAISRGAFGAAGMAATGGIAATTAARAAGRQMMPRGAIGSNALSRKGNTIRAYHGTAEDFDKFQPGIVKGHGDMHTSGPNAAPPTTYFTSDPKVSDYFAFSERFADVDNKSPRTIPVDIDNPNLFDYRNPAHVSRALDAEFQGRPPSERAAAQRALEEGDWTFFNNAARQRWISENGYDGWLEKETMNPGATTYVMFNKGKVKGPYTGDTLWSSGVPGLHATEDDY